MLNCLVTSDRHIKILTEYIDGNSSSVVVSVAVVIEDETAAVVLAVPVVIVMVIIETGMWLSYQVLGHTPR